MSAAEKHLNQLQREVKLVLEQTGRLFAASAKGEHGSTRAHISRLKQTVPRATDRFHEALDALEDELQLAKLVLRRDLAIIREQEPNPQNDNGTNGTASAPDGDRVSQSTEPPGLSVSLEPEASNGDVTMQDVSEPTANGVADAIDVSLETRIEAEPAPSTVAHTIPAAALADPPTAELEQPENPSDPSKHLHVDTQPINDAPNTDDASVEPDPETANTSSFDMDSLFGDTASAGGAAEQNNSNSNGTSSIGPGSTSAEDFSFGAFNDSFEHANNDGEDNISALLPGIGDYATTQPTGSGDSSSLGNVTVDDIADQAAENHGVEQRDSTFDDLMDFTDFNAGDYGGDDGDAADGETDFSFFPL